MRRKRNEHQAWPLARTQNRSYRACIGFLLAGMFAVLALLGGCSGLVSGQASPPPPPSQTHSIAGTISPAAGGSGTTVALSGATSASTTTDSAGNYTFTGLANGTYVVTPSHTGYTFTPSTQSVTVNGANVTAVNFSAVPQVPHSVLLSWNASTSTVSGYNVYRSTVSGTQYAKLNSALVGLAYTDTSVLNGKTYFYVTTAVDANGVESVYSNEVSANIP